MKPTLLLVEDDPTTRAFLHAASLPLGMEVAPAANMRQALALAAQTRYAAWLLDARLPDGSGIELLARLRRIQPDVPALAHTASADPAQLQSLREAGFALAVSKPLSTAAWQAALRAVLEGQVEPSRHIQRHTLPPLRDDAAGLKVLGGDARMLTALRRLFVQELPQQIAALERAHRHGDAAAITAELHRLSASCGFVGAARLAAAIRDWRGRPQALLDDVLVLARETLAEMSAVI